MLATQCETNKAIKDGIVRRNLTDDPSHYKYLDAHPMNLWTIHGDKDSELFAENDITVHYFILLESKLWDWVILVSVHERLLF